MRNIRDRPSRDKAKTAGIREIFPGGASLDQFFLKLHLLYISRPRPLYSGRGGSGPQPEVFGILHSYHKKFRDGDEPNHAVAFDPVGFLSVSSETALRVFRRRRSDPRAFLPDGNGNIHNVAFGYTA
jgi:hypothetical protein